MAVKYVKDFAFDSGFGFTGSKGATPVRAYMRGGAVKKAAPKAPSIAPAMVEKRSQGLGGLAKETKKLAAYDKPHMEGKKGAKVAQYAKGGAVKKHVKKPMAKMMKKAEGGEVSSPLKRLADIETVQPMPYSEPIPELGREAPPPMSPGYDEPYMTKSVMSEPSVEMFMHPDGIKRPYPPAPLPLEFAPAGNFTPVSEQYRRPEPDVPSTREDPGLLGFAPAPSPLARAAMPTKADRRDMRRDRMTQARDIMDRYIAGPRRAMPAPRRAMPVAPREPMVDRVMIAPRSPYMPTVRATTPEESDAYFRSIGRAPSPEGRYAKGGAVKKGQAKVGKVMGEFKRGELHSGSKQGPLVTNPKQAKAIALSEARAAGAKIPKKAMGGKACG